MNSSSAAQPKTRIRPAVLCAAGVLVVLSMAAFYYATRLADRKFAGQAQAYTVTIGAHACAPNSLTVPAGTATFHIVNQSERGVEWEILDGVMVLAERENIAPGFTQTLSAQLAPGHYAMTCGLLSNPRGELTVTPTDASVAASKAAPSLQDYIGPLSEYLVYQSGRLDALEQETAKLSAAIAAGDLQGARQAYVPAHAAYVALTPAASLFADLDTRLDARADNFEKREADPGFTGFRRIEYGLFNRGATDGLQPVMAQLTQDVQTLRARIGSLAVGPGRLLGAAAQRATLLAEWAPQGQASPSGADLADLAATGDGLRHMLAPMADLLRKTAPADTGAALKALDALDAQLAQHRQGDSYVPYGQLDAAARRALATELSTLAAALQRLAPAAGA
jgi:iron uptake system component EfeO